MVGCHTPSSPRSPFVFVCVCERERESMERACLGLAAHARLRRKTRARRTAPHLPMEQYL